MAWDFLVANRTAIEALLDPLQRLEFPTEIAAASSDPAMAAELETYARNFPEGARPTVAAATAAIRLRAQTVAERMPAVEAWIATHSRARRSADASPKGACSKAPERRSGFSAAMTLSAKNALTLHARQQRFAVAHQVLGQAERFRPASAPTSARPARARSSTFARRQTTHGDKSPWPHRSARRGLAKLALSPRQRERARMRR